ncbi:MAG: lactate utilization protein C [Rothia sp. (in: high G+C Gram-positive bacteria)]|nr:lactate utilization protein C [Rothia sp. (in: high G+C Gram-positive bacteria)]
MSDAKTEILGRIRASLWDHPQPAEPVRNYRRESNKGTEEIIEMLVDRLVDYKANVYQETEETIAGRIDQLLQKASRYVVPAGLNATWLPEDTATRAAVTDSGNVNKPGALGVRELDAIDAVVTSSTVSCAETGTIALNSGAEEGRRAISLVPDHHICVVPVDTIVEIIPETVARLDFSKPVTWISGPSATSDIELIRVEGVHGPRTLDVIILK